MRLIFIRHPKTEANERKLVYGRTDALYSEAGAATIPGIVEAIHEVDVDRIYASPLTRTRILAEKIAADHGIPTNEICMDERILEMDFGRFENMTISELEEKYPKEYHEYINDFNDYQVPGGESYRQLYQRVGEFLKEIYQRHERKHQEEVAAETVSSVQGSKAAEEFVAAEQNSETTAGLVSDEQNRESAEEIACGAQIEAAVVEDTSDAQNKEVAAETTTPDALELEIAAETTTPDALELEMAAETTTPDALELEVGEIEDDETQQWLNQRSQKDNGAWFEVKSVMDSLKKKKEETIVVVAHSMVIHAALAHLLNLDLNDVWHIKIEPGSVVDLDWRYDFAMLQHLAGPFNVREIK